MARRKEAEASLPQEIHFYGPGVQMIIEHGLKVGTCRLSQAKYSFEPGQVITAHSRDDGETEFPIMVLDVIKGKELGALPLSILSLDGFFSYKHAIEDLETFYPDVSLLSEMDYITFMPLARFRKLNAQTREAFTQTATEELLYNPRFREIFFPSIAFWMGVRGGIIDEYFAFLVSQDLVSEDEVQAANEAIASMSPKSFNTRITKLCHLNNWLLSKPKSNDLLYNWAILLRAPRHK